MESKGDFGILLFRTSGFQSHLVICGLALIIPDKLIVGAAGERACIFIIIPLGKDLALVTVIILTPLM